MDAERNAERNADNAEGKPQIMQIQMKDPYKKDLSNLRFICGPSASICGQEIGFVLT
jgi:hypothetical protein